MRKILILLALAVVTVQTVGCAGSRRWCHRGSPCVGTQIAAPTMVAAPVPVAAPAVTPQLAPPVMVPAPAPRQMVAPQPAVCCPQPVPCCPPAQCCPPVQCCPVPCCPQSGCDPCPDGVWFGGFVDGDCECGPVTSYDKGYIDSGTDGNVGIGTFGSDPGPAQEN